MGATINMQVKIGKEARVGNGATVKGDVMPRGRVFAGTIWPYRENLHRIQNLSKDRLKIIKCFKIPSLQRSPCYSGS